MKWTSHYKPDGVDEHHDVSSLDVRIHHYWTNETGDSIGFLKSGEHGISFTYWNGELDFTFSVQRYFERNFVGPTVFSRQTGPICKVYLNDNIHKILNSRDVRLKMVDIYYFLSTTFTHPDHPEDPLGKSISFPRAHLHLSNDRKTRVSPPVAESTFDTSEIATVVYGFNGATISFGSQTISLAWRKNDRRPDGN